MEGLPPTVRFCAISFLVPPLMNDDRCPCVTKAGTRCKNRRARGAGGRLKARCRTHAHSCVHWGETIVGETTRGGKLDRLPDEIWGMIQGFLAEDTNSMGLMGIFEPVRGRARGKLPLDQTWRDAVFDGLGDVIPTCPHIFLTLEHTQLEAFVVVWRCAELL